MCLVALDTIKLPIVMIFRTYIYILTYIYVIFWIFPRFQQFFPKKAKNIKITYRRVSDSKEIKK